MAIEIEVKMRLDDVDGLESRLLATGAERGPTILETNSYFDLVDGSLRRAGEGLRLRVERRSEPPELQVVITHKGPCAESAVKMRTETQLAVSEADGAAQLLYALGFRPTLEFEKRRRRWWLCGCTIEIDTLPTLGHFVEIEGPSGQSVLDVRQQLALAEQPLVQEGYAHLVAAHMGTALGSLTFTSDGG